MRLTDQDCPSESPNSAATMRGVLALTSWLTVRIPVRIPLYARAQATVSSSAKTPLALRRTREERRMKLSPRLFCNAQGCSPPGTICGLLEGSLWIFRVAVGLITPFSPACIQEELRHSMECTFVVAYSGEIRSVLCSCTCIGNSHGDARQPEQLNIVFAVAHCK